MMMQLKGKVLIEKLELHAYHGWHKHEGEFGQPYTINLELVTDLSRAADTDHLSDALDYGAIVATTKRIFTEQRHKLVESAAVELARGLLAEFESVEEVFVHVMKLKPPIPERIAAAGVSLRLTRAEAQRG
jgi:dihydroneopterin aldolase